MTTKINQKTLLSGLWGFILFTIFFADFHALLKADFLEGIQNGVAGGYEITEELLLFGAVFHMVPVSMFLLCLLLPRKINKWANVAAGSLYLFTNLTAIPSGNDQLFFRIFIIIGLLSIIYTALRWKESVTKQAL